MSLRAACGAVNPKLASEQKALGKNISTTAFNRYVNKNKLIKTEKTEKGLYSISCHPDAKPKNSPIKGSSATALKKK